MVGLNRWEAGLVRGMVGSLVKGIGSLMKMTELKQ